MGVIKSRRKKQREALSFFDRALAISPNNPDLLNNRGSALAETGRVDEACASYRKAIALRSDFTDAQNNLGCVLMNLGRYDEAAASYGKAVVSAPENAEFVNNLGRAMTKLRRYDDALSCYADAVELNPKYRDALINRAVTLNELKCYDEAIEYYSRALALKSDDTETLRKRASAFAGADNFDAALRDYDEAYRLRPDETGSLLGRAATLAKLGHMDQALLEFKRAQTLGADPVDVAIARALTLNEQDRLTDALADADFAVATNPKSPDAHNVRGLVLMNMERFADAVVAYGIAISLRRDFADSEWNRGYLALLLGNFLEGWNNYEGRRRQRGLRWTQLNGPEWKGEPIAGKRVLLYTEQAYGDVIHFARYVGLLSEMGAKVVFGVYPVLAALLSRANGEPEITLHGAETPPYHYHLPLMSVPFVLRHEEEHIPSKPYLSADPVRVQRWAERIPRGEFTIGIAWQGSKSIPGRAIPLSAFAPISKIPGVKLISLQKSDGLDQLSQMPEGMSVELLGEDFDSGPDAFLDTAAVMMNLDLIISCDTAIAHLAGALGRPLWLILKTVPDWRWMMERSDSPWYPTARLFRRAKTESWDETLIRVADELAELVDSERAKSSA